MTNKYDMEIDTSGLNCPLPLLKVKKSLSLMNSGQSLYVRATDPGSQRDIGAFIEQAGHQMVNAHHDDDAYYFVIRKG